MKYRYVVLIILTPMILLAILPFLIWQFKPPMERVIQVIDKTVPKDDYREHLGLFWVLDHEKVKDDEGDYYQKAEDYFGYDPITKEKDTGLTIPENVDLIYVADTYGIYTGDLQGKPTGERSKLLYGGLTIFDWNKIMAAKKPDTTLIMEFNSIASPTDNTTRKLVEQEMGFEWSGWIGRHFQNLSSDEVPPWLIRNYEKQYMKDWTFNGEGITFVHESDRVMVLNEKDINGRVDFDWTEEGFDHYPNVKDSHYDYWFDIITPDTDMTVEAEYIIDFTATGEKKLEEEGLPEVFPAIIHHPDERKYYFAGDFADIAVDYHSKWSLPSVFYSIYSFFQPDEVFFWENYIPMMEQILGESDANKDLQ